MMRISPRQQVQQHRLGEFTETAAVPAQASPFQSTKELLKLSKICGRCPNQRLNDGVQKFPQS